MEKVECYRRIVLDLIEKYVPYRPRGIEAFQVLDQERDHYMLMHDGFKNHRRYYGCLLHLQVHDGKVWIRHDGVEGGVAEELVERGVAREDVVLAFHPPYLRYRSPFYDKVPEEKLQAMAS
jgi:hypothetical protein